MIVGLIQPVVHGLHAFECAAVEGDAEHELAGRNARREVLANGGIRIATVGRREFRVKSPE